MGDTDPILINKNQLILGEIAIQFSHIKATELDLTMEQK